MKKYVQLVIFGALAAAVCSPIACGSKSGGFAQDPNGGGNEGGSSGSTSSSGSSGGVPTGSSSGGSSGGSFMTGDSSGGMGTGVCKTGMYSGTFSCFFFYDSDAGDGGHSGAIPDSGGLGPITGNLSFLLSQSISGELGTDTASGMFVLNAGITTGSASLSGTLDCNTGNFTGALSGGMYSLLGLFTGPFEGPLTSQYSGASFSFVDGTWSLTVPGEGYCPGTWTAAYEGAGDAGDQ